MGYVLDNAWHKERERLRALERVWDRGTQRHILERGLTAGWRCLEVGAGGGSITEWLCEQVGQTGEVVATDIDTRFVEAIDAPNLRVVRSDLVTDELRGGEYDLVHARALVEHLPEKQAIVKKLSGALAPGGWLILEDFDWKSSSYPAGPSETYDRITEAVLTLFEAAGYERDFGRRLPELLYEAGLEAIGAEGRSLLVKGGSEEAQFYLFTLLQVADGLVGSGLSTQELIDTAIAEMQNPDNYVMSPVVVAAWARRPS